MTIDTDKRPTFLGLTITGDISRGERRVKQRPREEFLPLVQALLDDPTIEAFGWRQYTPYFNDGEPCVFGAYGFWVLTTDTPEEPREDYEEDTYELEMSSHPALGRKRGHWVRRPREDDPGEWVDEPYTGPDEARFDRCRAVDHAIDRGEFDDVLLETFGDHAEIKITSEGVTLTEYSHD
ncbi:MAG TPA: hypothetical protein VJ140_05025 [Actinomycetota bacterium]|nr:hypothetical protein [Actinomycetota bacterium]